MSNFCTCKKSVSVDADIIYSLENGWGFMMKYRNTINNIELFCGTTFLRTQEDQKANSENIYYISIDQLIHLLKEKNLTYVCGDCKYELITIKELLAIKLISKYSSVKINDCEATLTTFGCNDIKEYLKHIFKARGLEYFKNQKRD